MEMSTGVRVGSKPEKLAASKCRPLFTQERPWKLTASCFVSVTPKEATCGTWTSDLTALRLSSPL